ncbi:MAG TPA: DUF6491 family protein [Steroidobacteraceae bacterium]|nr:DUF6491 family protein [Steroidobacteraceae bacterium]
MKSRVLFAVLPLIALTACAAFGKHESDEQALARYVQHAGQPVDGFTYLGRIDGWQPLGRDSLLVRTGVNEAYLLKVAQPCSELQFANSIGLTATGHQVSSRFDSVLVRGQRCMITEIRPVDYLAVKREASAQRAAAKQEAAQRRY